MAGVCKNLSHPKYRPDIDGLRAIAVLAVVGFHAFPNWVQGGFIGVDIFFVISGYLISTIIFENLDSGTFSFTEFYARRIKRIFPALIVMLMACFIFGWFALLADEYKQFGKHMAAGAGFVSNLVFWHEAGYFDNAAGTKPLLHLWSLGIEEQFYIVWPLLLWFAWKRKVNLATLVVVLAIISLVLNLHGINQDTIATFYSPQTRFWELLSGSIVAWVMLHKKIYSLQVQQTKNTTMLANLASFLGLFLLLYGFWGIKQNFSFPGAWALVPVIGTVLLIIGGSTAWINRTLLSHQVAVWFGLISFPLYLWHWPLLSFARIVESETPNRGIRIAAVMLAIVLAWLTYRLVERPIRFGPHRKMTLIVLVTLMMLLGLAGYCTFKHEGYASRSAMQRFVNNKNELLRTPAQDDQCLHYIGQKNPLFPYCRFTNVHATETVAIIGDSHAHVAYPGISEYLSRKKINTVLLANSSCPPFMGSYTGSNRTEQNNCRDRIEQLLETVSSHPDIKQVLVFTRGPYYTTGTEPLTGNQDVSGDNRIPMNQFVHSAQLSFNRLSRSGKVVFYITENPELSYSPESCVTRPFKPWVKNCSVDKNVVLKRQQEYLMAFHTLKKVTIIDSLHTFCPKNNCLVFDEQGALLYADDDHLSVAGSRFQARKLLQPLLEKKYPEKIKTHT